MMKKPKRVSWRDAHTSNEDYFGGLARPEADGEFRAEHGRLLLRKQNK